MSVFTEYTPLFCLISVGIVTVGSRIVQTATIGANGDEQVNRMNGAIKPFLSNYRAAMMLATCTAILAVDFNLFFPVRFAKCEEYGISLMDVGVGGFIFSSALTSAKQRAPPSLMASSHTSSQSSTSKNSPAKRESLCGSSSSFVSWSLRLLQSLKMVVPLLVLGLGRFTVIKAFGYQEHVTEYGMHWNFFMTLAGITLLVAALNIPLEYSGLCGIVILVVYHYVLEAMGVAQWIIEAPRVDFFTQNREGILSCFGYLSLYLFGRQVGSYLMRARSRSEWWRATAYLASGGAILWAGASSMRYFLDMLPSRRMVNMPYALYTLAGNFIIISAFIVVDLLQETQPNALFDAVATRRNSQLVIFTLVRLIPTPPPYMSFQTEMNECMQAVMDRMTEGTISKLDPNLLIHSNAF